MIERVKYKGQVGTIVRDVGPSLCITFEGDANTHDVPKSDCSHYIGDQVQELITNLKPKGQRKRRIPVVFFNYQF